MGQTVDADIADGLPYDGPPAPADTALPAPDPEFIRVTPMETMAYCPSVLASPISAKNFTPLAVRCKSSIVVYLRYSGYRE